MGKIQKVYTREFKEEAVSSRQWTPNSILGAKIAGAYRELERVQQERDILKKAISIFSRESR